MFASEQDTDDGRDPNRMIATFIFTIFGIAILIPANIIATISMVEEARSLLLAGIAVAFICWVAGIIAGVVIGDIGGLGFFCDTGDDIDKPKPSLQNEA